MKNETPVILFCLGLASSFIGLFLSAHENSPLPNFFAGVLVGMGIAIIAVAFFSAHYRGRR